MRGALNVASAKKRSSLTIQSTKCSHIRAAQAIVARLGASSFLRPCETVASPILHPFLGLALRVSHSNLPYSRTREAAAAVAAVSKLSAAARALSKTILQRGKSANRLVARCQPLFPPLFPFFSSLGYIREPHLETLAHAES